MIPELCAILTAIGFPALLPSSTQPCGLPLEPHALAFAIIAGIGTLVICLVLFAPRLGISFGSYTESPGVKAGPTHALDWNRPFDHVAPFVADDREPFDQQDIA